ncbi:ATP synthase mitochondrial F1 complex assembly factor 1-like isoform X1 [Corticium candelabrum]|uniref:ATP synthase mitochondrial F1 complex assembly factor 1-like isoform X1 n=1 Tax=Corticium candelabrum TaxID=121492 RepID=UPI002E25EF54|nr:ATP synthase mitochondrial F1 complex assembly factor 1-like isoform X1 [Corticium candelabrum]
MIGRLCWLSARCYGCAARSYSQKSLSSVLRLDLIQEKTGEEIGQLWTHYHKTKDCISAVIADTQYDELYARSQLCPRFVYPIPNNGGYEFVYSQFSGHLCFFTALATFQSLGENAPILLTVTHYPELKNSKGIVLMKGDFTSDLSTLEAQFLANQLQLYYTSRDKARWSLVRNFNFSPQDFDYMLLIKQLERSEVAIDSK